MSDPDMTDQIGMEGDAPSQADESNKTMSLMGGIVRPEGLPDAQDFAHLDSGKGGKKVLSQGTMLIVLVAAIAAGTLYLMRVSNRETGTNAKTKTVEAKIDQALAKLATPKNMTASDPLKPDNIKKLFEDTDDIIAMFSADLTQRQVPVQFIKKNPFVLPVFQSVRPEADSPDADTSKKAAEERVRMLRQELKRYELQSIMQGSRPVAVISGELVQPGHTLGSFKVTAIHDRTVELQNSGATFTLTMEKEERRSGSSRGF